MNRLGAGTELSYTESGKGDFQQKAFQKYNLFSGNTSTPVKLQIGAILYNLQPKEMKKTTWMNC